MKGATPYEFGYDIADEHGNKQSRQESGDAAGNQRGSYSIDLVDGRKRIVDYVADGNGFKAVVRSNEPGTDPSQDPADVQREPLGQPIQVVEVPKPEPPKPKVVKVVRPAASYGYGHHGYGHGYGLGYGHGHGLGHGYSHGLGHGYGYGHNYGQGYGHGHGYGHGYGHGGYSRSYNKRYESPKYSHGHHGYYHGVPSYAYRNSHGPSYSYGNTYAPGPAYRYW